MEMHEIRYVLAVCETLNFTRAAERCNVSQPALTRAVQKVEAELGGLLFRRERNLTHLTDLGRLLKPKLEEIYREAEAVKRTAKSFLALESAALKVGVMCTIGPLRFIGFLNRFRIDNPGIELTLVEGVPDRLSELLLAGEIDVALMAQPQAFDERLDARTLYREAFVVACSHGHRLAQKNAVALEDLDGEAYLLRINCEYRDRISELCQDHGSKLKHVWRSEREDWILTMVAGGMGVCFLPEYSATVPGVVTRRVADPEIVREVAIVTVAGRRFSPAVAAFVKASRAYRWPSGPEGGSADAALAS